MKFSREFYFRAVLLREYYNPRELEWFAQLKGRKNKIAQFLKDIFWVAVFSLTKYQHSGCFSLVKPNFFCRCAKIVLRENEKMGLRENKMREKKMRENFMN